MVLVGSLRNRLMLGTAQLTQAYGAFADAAPRDEPAVLLKAAFAEGIRAIDTAAQYGEAERAIGEVLQSHPDIEVVTKCEHIPMSASPSEKARIVDRSIIRSLERLRLKRLPGFLLHSAASFDRDVADAFEQARRAGTVERLGVSIYTGEDIEHVCSLWRPDIIQVPLNLADQRLLASGHLQKLHAQGVEIHVRSAFLQGMLLAGSSALGPRFAQLQPGLKRLEQIAGSHHQDRLSVCLGFVASIPEVDRIIVGAQNVTQLHEIVAAADAAMSPDNPAQFAVSDPQVVDPRLWTQ